MITKFKIFINGDAEKLCKDIEKFIEGKIIKDIKYSCLPYVEGHMGCHTTFYYSVMIIYEEPNYLLEKITKLEENIKFRDKQSEKAVNEVIIDMYKDAAQRAFDFNKHMSDEEITKTLCEAVKKFEGGEDKEIDQLEK